MPEPGGENKIKHRGALFTTQGVSLADGEGGERNSLFFRGRLHRRGVVSVGASSLRKKKKKGYGGFPLRSFGGRGRGGSW